MKEVRDNIYSVLDERGQLIDQLEVIERSLEHTEQNSATISKGQYIELIKEYRKRIKEALYTLCNDDSIDPIELMNMADELYYRE